MSLFAAHSVAAELRRRELVLLLHSTHLYRNLPQILKDGALHTVRRLRELYGESASRYLHDPRRYETLAVGLDYLNASLTQPNAPLLYHRSKTEWKSEWVHFALPLDRLARADTLFCPVSAAAGFGQHLQPRLAGLQAMFADRVEDYDRAGLAANLPTHPQAEVLLHGSIALEEVNAVYVPDAAIGVEVERLCELHARKLKVEVAPHLFVWPERLLKQGKR